MGRLMRAGLIGVAACLLVALGLLVVIIVGGKDQSVCR